MLAAHPKAIFLGQNVEFDGNVMYAHLEGVPAEQRLELPVVEELQMGISTGLALQGFLPISLYPRCDFLLRAADQLINHLDKLCFMSQGQFNPKVIIRTRVGSVWPLNAGPQHTQDHSSAFKAMLNHVHVDKITEPEQIMPIYKAALKRDRPTLIVEKLDP